MTHSRPLSQDLASRIVTHHPGGVSRAGRVAPAAGDISDPTHGNTRPSTSPCAAVGCEVSKGGMGWPSKGFGLIDGGFGAVPRFGTHLANRSMKLPMPPQLFEETKNNLHIFSHLLPSSPIFSHLPEPNIVCFVSGSCLM